jgi:hypothetical protein
MRSIKFNNEVIKFDFSLGCINDVFVKELGGNFDDLVNMQDYENEPNKLVDLTRDILLSGHIYWLFVNGEDDKAESLLGRLKGSRMIATKWLFEAKVANVISWITEDMMPSDMGQPSVDGGSVKGKKK